MNIEDIKVGETYNVRMKVTHKEKDQVCVKNPMISVYGCDYMIISHEYIHAIHEQLKHDPCRLFKKGDKVKRRTVNGRTDLDVPEGIELTVTTDEAKYGNVRVEEPNGRSIVTKAVFLELLTPVEELEPYYIMENDIEFQVRMKYEDKNCLISVFRFKNIVEGYKQYYDMLPTMKQAREAAEAECKRLNEEYRKEQK